jgi:hypothetical protein
VAAVAAVCLVVKLMLLDKLVVLVVEDQVVVVVTTVVQDKIILDPINKVFQVVVDLMEQLLILLVEVAVVQVNKDNMHIL